MIAIADEAAAAADLVRAKDSREPAVRLRGLERHVTAEDGPGVAALVRRARGRPLPLSSPQACGVRGEADIEVGRERSSPAHGS